MGRLLANIGPHFYFLLYFLVCLYTANERILYTDSAYYLYNMINDGFFYVPHNRYLAALAQLVPMAGIRFDLSLAWVVKLYALNIALIPYVGYIVVRYLWKQPFFALTFILLSSVFQHHAFFSPIAELVLGLYIGLTWLGFAVKIIRHRRLDVPNIFMALILLGALFITHPVTIASTLLATLILVWYHSNRWGYLLSGALLATMLTKVLTFNSYESGKWGIFNISWSSLPEMATSYVSQFLLAEFVTVLLPAIAFFLYVAYLLWIERFRLLCLVLMAMLPAFFFFTILLNYRYETFYAYVEGYMTPFFFVISAIGLHVMHGSPDNRPYRMKVVYVVLTIAIVSLVRLTWEPAYRQEKDFLSQVMTEASEKGCYKVEIQTSGAILEPNILTRWSVPYETILYSSLDGNSSSVVFYEGYDRDTSRTIGSREFLGADWERVIPYERLNQRYLRLPEGAYCNIHRSRY